MKRGLVVLAFLLAVSTVCAINLSSCGDITSPGTFTLTQNIQNDTGCLEIVSDNVTIDCVGYTINYDSGGASGNAYGVFSNTHSNISVKNCIINDLVSDNADHSTYGVYFVAVNNGTVFNNSITSTGGTAVRPIYFSQTNGVNISDNTLLSNGSGNSNYGLLFQGSSNNYILGNSVTVDQRLSVAADAIGMYITLGSWNNVFYDNYVRGTTSVSERATSLYLYDNVSYNSFDNNSFIVDGIPSQQGRVVFAIPQSGRGISYNNFTNNLILLNTTTPTTVSEGLLISTGVGNRIVGNTIETKGNTANNDAVVLGTLNDTVFANNTISVGDGSVRPGFRTASSYSAVISGNVFNDMLTWINFSDSSNATFTDLTFNSSEGSIKFDGPLTFTGPQTVTNTTTYVTSNFAFHNSSAISQLNTSARITLRNLLFVNSRALVDFDDDGTFDICNPPQCVEVSDSSTEFVFDVLSFTTYSAEQYIPPVPEFSTYALLAALVLIAGGYFILRDRLI